MIPLLSLFTFLQYLLSLVHNTKEEQLYLVILSFSIYLLYFVLLKKIFTSKTVPVLTITIFALISFFGYVYATPKLSNDIYRYLWDGLLVKNEFNPYIYVPSDWKLHDLQEANMALYKKVDWKDKFTPYPPFSQYIFATAHTFYDRFGLVGGKFIFALPFLLSAFFIYYFFDKIPIKKQGISQYITAKKLYASFILNPLLLLEIVGNSHLDGWVVFFMIVGLYLFEKKKYILFSIVWALAILTKIYPLIFVPYFALHLIRQKKFKEVFLSTCLGFFLLYLFYMPFIRETFFAITRYIDLPNEQEYNASLYRYVYLAIGKQIPFVMQTASKITGFLFLLGAILLMTRKYSLDIILSVGLLYILCSPIAFPWYFLFLFPICLFISYKEQNERLLILICTLQCVLIVIYYEPGAYFLRELMLNTEYFLLFVLAILYKVKLGTNFKFSVIGKKGVVSQGDYGKEK